MAETLAQYGALAEALATIDEAISSIRDQLVDLPYLLWLRGELLVRNADRLSNDSKVQHQVLESAQRSFCESISVSQNIGAKTLALRAATSLARLSIQNRCPSDGMEVLATSLEGFTEGFDTRDLIEATDILIAAKKDRRGLSCQSSFADAASACREPTNLRVR